MYLGVPDTIDGQARILKTHLQKLRLDGDAESLSRLVGEKLARQRLTGADLSAVASSALLSATERLCQEADRDLEDRRQAGEIITLEQVLESWGDNRLEPIVTLDDLLEASETVVPSVTAGELERYEQLSKQFRTMS